MLSAGDLVAGKFQIDRVIGHGGMGFVVAATHIHLGQRVALKFLLPGIAKDRAIVERFLREARASAQLRSEHVCRVSDVGVLDDGAPYFVMELLEGRDLSSLLAERGPLPIATLADYVVQACTGLAEAHAARIVHRDLKPANLFITHRPDGSPLIKIVDFGIAKSPVGVEFHLTRTDAVMGSPGYMSPEQLRSTRLADARSDIWALGVCLYELSTGRQPFTAESITDLALRIAIDPTPAVRGPAIPAGFERVVHRCLEKDPARRFPDVAQLAAALAPFGGPAIRERAAGVARVLAANAGPAAPDQPVATAPGATTTLGSSAASIEGGSRDRKRWLLPLAALAAGAIATIAFTQLRGGASRTDEPHIDVSAPHSVPPVRVPVEPAPAAQPTAPPATAPSPPAAAPASATAPAASPPSAASPPAAAATPSSAAVATPAPTPAPAVRGTPAPTSRPDAAALAPRPGATQRPDAGSRKEPGARRDPATRPDGAPPVRKVTRPPEPKSGSDVDVGESRL